MKKLKINYLFIGILALLLAVALWPSIPWFGKADNRIAAIQARGELRVSTIHTPLTYNEINGKPFGLDYELAKQFADYLGVKLKVTVRQNISQLFDDLDNGNADLLAAGLVYNSERVKNYQPGPTYYSVSQQLVYRVGQYRPRTLATVNENQLTIAPGHVVVNDLQTLKDTKFPELSWKVDDKKGSAELMEDVIEGKLDYTIADSVAISLFQRVHPELAVALDITDEQPVTWFSPLDGDNTLSAALLDFFNEMNEDGTLARIEEKYLGHGDDFDYVDTRTFLRAVDAVLPQLKPLFEKYAEEIDWRLLAAIAYQESHWDAQATSPTGVRGMMMLTKNTAQSLGVKLGNAKASLESAWNALNQPWEGQKEYDDLTDQIAKMNLEIKHGKGPTPAEEDGQADLAEASFHFDESQEPQVVRAAVESGPSGSDSFPATVETTDVPMPDPCVDPCNGGTGMSGLCM